MQILVSVFVIIAMALVHRLRGGGFVSMPVKGTYVLWPLVGLMAYLLGYSVLACAVWAVGYLIWIVPGWMNTITRAMGAVVPHDQIMGSGWDVRIVDTLSFDHPVFGCYVRATLYLIPLAVGLVLCGYNPALLLVVVLAFYPSYRLGFALRPTDMSSIAEILVGCSVGVALAGTKLLPLL